MPSAALLCSSSERDAAYICLLSSQNGTNESLRSASIKTTVENGSRMWTFVHLFDFESSVFTLNRSTSFKPAILANVNSVAQQCTNVEIEKKKKQKQLRPKVPANHAERC